MYLDNKVPITFWKSSRHGPRSAFDRIRIRNPDPDGVRFGRGLLLLTMWSQRVYLINLRVTCAVWSGYRSRWRPCVCLSVCICLSAQKVKKTADVRNYVGLTWCEHFSGEPRTDRMVVTFVFDLLILGGIFLFTNKKIVRNLKTTSQILLRFYSLYWFYECYNDESISQTGGGGRGWQHADLCWAIIV